MCVVSVFLRGPFPAIMNWVWGCFLVICLAASIRCGRPFLGISLPTKSMQSLLFSPSWCLIFWQFSVGLNFWVSTPLGMTRIFVLSMLYSWVIFLAEYLLTVTMRFAFLAVSCSVFASCHMMRFASFALSVDAIVWVDCWYSSARTPWIVCMNGVWMPRFLRVFWKA